MIKTLALPLAIVAGPALAGATAASNTDRVDHGGDGAGSWLKDYDQACYCLPLEERLAHTRDESARPSSRRSPARALRNSSQTPNRPGPKGPGQ